MDPGPHINCYYLFKRQSSGSFFLLFRHKCSSEFHNRNHVKLGSWHGSPINKCQAARKLSLRIYVNALKDDRNGGTSSFSGQSWDPGLEIEVPFEQRPVNEYSSLKDGVLYSWGELGPGPFFLRLGGLWLATFTVLGIPIAAASFNPSREPLRFMLAAGTGTLFLVSLIVLRIYLGWSYVGDRLLSAVIPYEESGWYDGQMWVKPPEVLARDRLLGAYKVKPVIKMLKQTLVGTGALLVTAVFLFVFATPVQDFFQTTFSTKENLPEVTSPKSNSKFNIRKEELLQLPVEVMADDDLAAAAAEAADGRPVYCRDRYYRALAGGQYFIQSPSEKMKIHLARNKEANHFNKTLYKDVEPALEYLLNTIQRARSKKSLLLWKLHDISKAMNINLRSAVGSKVFW